MGVKKMIAKAGGKAADKVARLAALSPSQLEKVENQKLDYLSQKPDPNDEAAVELTSRLIAASSVEIYNSYLPQLSELYIPIEDEYEYESEFNANYNVRFVNITKWVTNKDENSIEKLINVYEVLSSENCNIALVFNRTCIETNVYLAVTNTQNDGANNNADDFIRRITSAVKGNFPGSELGEIKSGGIPCLKSGYKYSIASASNVPTEKSEKFISQTIEKILDGIVPDEPKREYTLILLATPIQDVEERKIKLASFFSALNPYASWQTTFQYNQSDTTSSMAVFGVNVGASAGVQNSQSNASTQNESVSDQKGGSEADSQNINQSKSKSEAHGTNEAQSSNLSRMNGSAQNEIETIAHADSSGGAEGTMTNEVHSDAHMDSNGFSGGGGFNAGIVNVEAAASSNVADTHVEGTSIGTSDSSTWNITDTTSTSIGSSTSQSTSMSRGLSSGKSDLNTVANTISHGVGRTVARTFGKAVTTGVAAMSGAAKATSFGVNAGANFARSSTVTAQIGKSEGITQSFVNYNIKHALDKLEQQMKRYETSTALGMWDFAAYVVSEDINTANNVAHTYVALTQGEESYMSQAAVNLWRGDLGDQSFAAKEIFKYLRNLRHPLFGLNPDVLEQDHTFLVYPNVVNATTALSGKELAYSLNFPRKSISGLPVFECAEFGRNVVKYGSEKEDDSIQLGRIFHMNHEEPVGVDISLNSLTSHAFITGSTGSGKSNTIYTILERARENDVHFLVIEPAKGEYKNVFGNDTDVSVYGTNHKLMNLLRINPFSFPSSIHVLEHMDRLVELFNVCWPMYAAMPAVLKDAVERSYIDCGWDLIESTNTYGANLYPCFADVARNVKEIIDSSEYDNENKGAYKGSLLTRLKSLTNGINGMIFSNKELSPMELFDENVIVDLSRVGSSETKSLIMGMLVLKLQEYRVSVADSMNERLKHITVLEEAHNILKRTSTEQLSESGNLMGKSVEMLSNAIAEMRTYGEGFIIADQAPGLLDMSVIRNTNTKIIMRLPDMNDRDLVGKAANLNDNQIKELAKLPCGVGAVYQNEWIQPVLCKVDRIVLDEQQFAYTPGLLCRSQGSVNDRISIATMLSKGVHIDTLQEIKDINRILESINANSYIRVSILKMLENPPSEPRMTKLAPIMATLFPEIKDSVSKAYAEVRLPTEWTKAAEYTLASLGAKDIESIVRRDIIQGVITYYFLNEINNATSLREWRERGGLS